MSIPEQISGISLGSAYIRPGTVGPITSVTYIAGGWITVDSKANLDAIDQSRTSTGQLAFVSESQQFYIATKVPADFETTFDDTVSWTEFTFSGSFSGSFSGDGSGLTGVGGVPGGTAGQLQYNSASAFGGAEVYYTSGGSIGIGITNPSARLVVAGDAVITGKITAEEFHTEFVSASIIYQSGSTKFGNSADDNHIFTGTVNITGSVIAPRFSGSFSGSFQGDGSQLTGIASTLALSGSTGNDLINLKTEALTLTGPTNNIGVTVASNTATIAVSNNLTLTNVNLTGSFTGNFSGSIDAIITNAISASFATNAVSASVSDKVKVSTSGTNASYYPTFVGGTGYQDVLIDSGNNITYNPSTNALTATTFVGALTGNASTATSATSASFAVTASYATGYVKDGGGVADQIMVWKDGETASGSAALRYNTGGATLNITGNVLATSFTGSFTGSFAGLISNAISASYATTASYAVSASYAATATFAVDSTYSANTSINVKNVSGGSIPKGTPCYVTESGTSGNVVGIIPADAGNPNLMPAGTIAGETIADGAEGIGLLDGYIEGVDTSLFVSGDEVFVAVGGGYTNSAPTGSAIVQKLGNVTKIHPSAGAGVINGPKAARSVPNINPGYTWVGATNWVATAVPTSSFSVARAVSSSHALYANSAGTATTATSASFATYANTAGSATTATTAATASFVAGYAKGTGVANQVTIWKDSSTVSGSGWLTVTSSFNNSGIPATLMNGNYYSYAQTATGGNGFIAFSGSADTTASLMGVNVSQFEGQLYSGDAGEVKSAIRLSTFYTDAYTIGRFLTPGASNLLRIAPDVLILGTTTINGDLVVGGKVTAEEFHTEFVSASIIFQSGSTIFGNSSDDTHLFTGSVSISHQLYAGLDSEVRPQVVGYNSSTGELTYFNSSSILATAIPGGSDNQVQYNNNGAMAGASNFVWDGTNVGIGTVTPSYKLDISGGNLRVGSNSPLIDFVDQNNADKAWRVNANGADSKLYIQSYNDAFSSGNTRVTIQHADGNVGIGTTSPAYLTHIATTLTGTSAGDNTGLLLESQADGRDVNIRFGDSVNASGRVGYLSGNIYILTNATERVRVTLNGNVGIGTTSPGSKLTVNGAIESITDPGGEGGQLILRGPVYRYNLDNYSGSRMRFFREDDATAESGSELFSIASTGQLRANLYGSGTFTGTPAKTLAVTSNGTVIELDVSSNGTGAANQVAFWKDTDTVSGSASLTWNGTTFYINGTLEATEKSFVIDHPLLPGKKLVYGVLEGPEHAVYCRGKINGEVIQLPEEWTGLVDSESITVQLTPIGRHQNLYVVDIKDNKVFIKNGDLLTSKILAYYYIQATRKDVKPLQTVRDK